MLVEKSCPFCNKKSSIFVSDDAWAKYESGVNIRSALSELDDFGREVVITGMCFNCQEKTFHRPLKEHAAQWGECLGECPICGCSVYEHKDKDGDVYKCNSCWHPLRYNTETNELEEVEDLEDAEEEDTGEFLEILGFLVLRGFNTKQWWVYDETHDYYIDPPPEIQEYVKSQSDDISVQENVLKEIVATYPDWLKSGNGIKDIEI